MPQKPSKSRIRWVREFVLRRFGVGVLLLMASLIIGQSGYVLLEKYTMTEAFYMTVITLSSVGFTEVRPLSEAGRIFPSFYIIINLGIFAYAIGIITFYKVGGHRVI